MKITFDNLLNWWGKKGERFIKWFESEKDTKRKILKTLILILGLIVGVEIVSSIVGLFIIYIPKLFSFLIVLCIIIPSAIILLTPILLVTEKKHSTICRKIWSSGFLFLVILALLSLGIWWFGGEGTIKIPLLFRKLFHNEQSQCPIVRINSLAIDKNNDVYIALITYCRIQKYDGQGKFIKGWFVDSGTGYFNIWLEEDHIHTFLASKDRVDVFDLDGQPLQSQKVLDDERLSFYDKGSGLEAYDCAGNHYVVKSPLWFPKVEKIDSDGEVVVLLKDPFYLGILNTYQGYFLAIIVIVLGAILGLIVKVKKLVRKYNLRLLHRVA